MENMWKLVFIPLVLLAFIGCQSEGDNSQNAQEQAPESMEQPDQQQNAPQNQPPQQPGQVNIPAGEDGQVHHYICEDGCEGGHSTQAGNCPVCNKPLAHNQAWHDQQNNNQQPDVQLNDQSSDRQQFDPMRGGDQQPPQQQQMEQPGQVDIPAGSDGVVHHYICPDQCEGGHGSSAGPCPVCSKQMAHNQAWHNQ